MKLTIKEINQQVVPQIQRMAQANPDAKPAIEKFFQQYGKIYEDERFKQLSGAIDQNKKLLQELELKEQYRGNIAKLEEQISGLAFDFQPVVTPGEVPAEIRALFPEPTPVAPLKVVEDQPAGRAEIPHPFPAEDTAEVSEVDRKVKQRKAK